MILRKNFKKYLHECNKVKTIVHWYDLYDKHYLKLEKAFQKELFQSAVKKAGGFSELGRKLNIGRKTISGCSKSLRNPQIVTLKRVVEYLNIPPQEINSKIISLGKYREFKPMFPFNLHNCEGAEIRAAFLSDGHIDKNPIKPPQYCAYEKELHERLIRLCQKVFGNFETKTCPGHKTYVTRFPAAIGDALELGGVPRGDKRIKNCFLPKDILLADKDIQRSYIRRAFDDEGDVSVKKRTIRITRSVRMNEKIETESIPLGVWTSYNLKNNAISNLLFGEYLLLSKLGINSKIYSEGIYKNKKGEITAKYRIEIKQQDRVKKFYEEVNFNLNDKKNKLLEIIGSYPYHKLAHEEGKKHALKIMQKFYKQKSFFKYGDLGREIVKSGRSFDLASKYIKHFCEKGIIERIGYGKYTFKQSNRD
ncbi:MAG: hypothetical protein WCV90_03490 [Candidatus Woesearchaeota archaeon]|jgi:hypothetical protein